MKKFVWFAIAIIGFSLSMFAEIKSFIYTRTIEDEVGYFAVYYDNECDIGEIGIYYDESYVLELNFRPEIYTNGFTYIFDGFEDGDFSEFEPEEDDTDLDKDVLRIWVNLLKRYGYFRVDVYSDPTARYTMEYFLVGENKIMQRNWVATEDKANNKKKRR